MQQDLISHLDILINRALLSISKHDGAAVPIYTSSQRTIERKRKKQLIPLPRPRTFDEILIPDELKIINGGKRFLLYDNGDSNNRILILSSDNDLDRLSNSDHWHSDGTFKVNLIYAISCIRYFVVKYFLDRPPPTIRTIVCSTWQCLWSNNTISLLYTCRKI